MDSARTRLVDQALNKTRLESEMSKNSPLRSISLDRVANRCGYPLFLQILADFFYFLQRKWKFGGKNTHGPGKVILSIFAILALLILTLTVTHIFLRPYFANPALPSDLPFATILTPQSCVLLLVFKMSEFLVRKAKILFNT